MILDILQPVDFILLEQFQGKPSHVFGNSIEIHTSAYGLPDLEGVRIAIFTISDDDMSNCDLEWRRDLYSLFTGNWDVTVADLGVLIPSDDTTETENQITKVVEYILKNNTVPIVLGGSQQILYSIYRAFDRVKRGVHLLTVDSKFNFDTVENLEYPYTFMSRIITEEPLNLFNLVNMGYQTYYVAQEEIDLLDKMLFDAYRLGVITSDITLTEHIIRSADIMSINVLGSVKATDMGLTDKGIPNGLTSRELCVLSRYAGMSSSVSAFTLLGCPAGYIANRLTAQAVWYFIEGYNHREVEVPSIDNPSYERYTVSLDYCDISFYKSLKTSRWWIEFTEIPGYNTPMVFPCSDRDYSEACKGILPQTWERMYTKLINYQKQ